MSEEQIPIPTAHSTPDGKQWVTTDERDAAIREREEAKQRHARECAKCAALADKVIALRARVAELEEQLESVADRAAAAEMALEAAPAASGVPDVVRDMTDILRSNADADEKHAALATLVEAVCPGFELARNGSWQAANAEAFVRLQKQFDAEWNGTAPAASGAAGTATWFAAVGKFGMKNVCMAFDSFEQCEEFANGEVRIVPLYAEPQAAPGWLTAEERGSIWYAIEGLREAASRRNNGHARTLESILARSSPPDVVLPVAWREAAGDVMSADEVREALAAAGVTCKEVG